MKLLKQTVGIDISMDKFDVRFATLNLSDKGELQHSFLGQATFMNTAKGHKEFLLWANKQKVSGGDESPVIFIMEATGVYYENLAYFLSENKGKVAVVLPNKTKNYSRTLENKSKTDRLDADMLAQYGLEKELECWKIPAEIMKKLKVLTREYHTLKEMRTQIQNRLHAHEHSHKPEKEITVLLKSQIAFFNSQIKTLEKKILKLIKNDKDLFDRMNKIDQIEGVGPMTIISILAETDCFALVRSAKQLASYAGLDVVHRESGRKQGRTAISKKGNGHIRKTLYMPALCAIRCNPVLKNVYQRLMSKGKHHKVAHIAIARKLLILIYTIWKKNENYVKNYQSAAAICAA